MLRNDKGLRDYRINVQRIIEEVENAADVESYRHWLGGEIPQWERELLTYDLQGNLDYYSTGYVFH